jgi:hypothetical protein
VGDEPPVVGPDTDGDDSRIDDTREDPQGVFDSRWIDANTRDLEHATGSTFEPEGPILVQASEVLGPEPCGTVVQAFERDARCEERAIDDDGADGSGRGGLTDLIGDPDPSIADRVSDGEQSCPDRFLGQDDALRHETGLRRAVQVAHDDTGAAEVSKPSDVLPAQRLADALDLSNRRQSSRPPSHLVEPPEDRGCEHQRGDVRLLKALQERPRCHRSQMERGDRVAGQEHPRESRPERA